MINYRLFQKFKVLGNNKFKYLTNILTKMLDSDLKIFLYELCRSETVS
jgi:hypothetical protein